MIEFKCKGAFFFDWELKLLEEIGFKFPQTETKKGFEIIKILEDPKPLKETARRLALIRQLPERMQTIKIVNCEVKFDQIRN